MTTSIGTRSGGPPRETAPVTPPVSPSREAAQVRLEAADCKASPAPESQPTWESAALAEINEALKLASIGVQFTHDRRTDTTIAQVADVETGKLIRHMPSEEVVQLSKVLGKLHDLLVHQAICRKAQLTDHSQAPAPARWSSPWTAIVPPGREAGASRPVKI